MSGFENDCRSQEGKMDVLSAVNQWLEAAKKLMGEDLPIPLIDSGEVDMTHTLLNAFMFGDEGLRHALESLLARDPNDIAARFVALNAYHQLMTLDVIEKEEVVEDQRQEFRKHLGFLVRLRDVEDCTDVSSIRWEIVNACAIADFKRAVRLCERLEPLLPPAQAHAVRGRLHFLISFEHAWNEENPALAMWDLPLGPYREGAHSIFRWAYTLRLFTEGLQLIRTNQDLSEHDREALRDTISYLEKAYAVQSNMSPTCHLMLARSYDAVGDAHNSARCYQRMISQQTEFLQSCSEELGIPWPKEFGVTIIQAVYACLVKAYEECGDIEKALATTAAWVNAYPDQLGTYERVARLHQKRGDYPAAHKWLRMEADRNPALGEDPNASIALALGDILSTTRIDEVLDRLAASHPEERNLASSLISTHWPIYAKLCPESQLRWATGALFMSKGASDSVYPGLAAHCLAWVVERELHTTVFAPFCEMARSDRGILNTGSDEKEETRLLSRYLAGQGTLSLGQMFSLLRLASRPSSQIVASFAQWLKRERPWLLPQLERFRVDQIIRLRNREDHADIQSIKLTDAQAMSVVCRDFLAVLHQRAGQVRRS